MALLDLARSTATSAGGREKDRESKEEKETRDRGISLP